MRGGNSRLGQGVKLPEGGKYGQEWPARIKGKKAGIHSDKKGGLKSTQATPGT